MGKTNWTYVCNVSNALGGYDSIQGYTCNQSNQKHFFTSMKKDINNANKLYQYTANGSSHTDSTAHCGHGNDCAYYDGLYYVARGGGKAPEIPVKDPENVYVYNGSFTQVGIRTYTQSNNLNPSEALAGVTQIASMGGGYFLLGLKDRCSVCRLEADRLMERTRFDVSAGVKQVAAERDVDYDNGIVRQGIYCANHKLYKVVSILKNKKIQENNIIEIYLNGTWPEVTSGTYQKNYQWDRPDQSSFEVEDISSPDSGETIYGIANSTDGKWQTDAIYRITLN